MERVPLCTVSLLSIEFYMGKYFGEFYSKFVADTDMQCMDILSQN